MPCDLLCIVGGWDVRSVVFFFNCIVFPLAGTVVQKAKIRKDVEEPPTDTLYRERCYEYRHVHKRDSPGGAEKDGATERKTTG